MQRFIDLFMLFQYLYIRSQEEIDEPLPPATLTLFPTKLQEKWQRNIKFPESEQTKHIRSEKSTVKIK